jgi:hypothetical protein
MTYNPWIGYYADHTIITMTITCVTITTEKDNLRPHIHMERINLNKINFKFNLIITLGFLTKIVSAVIGNKMSIIHLTTHIVKIPKGCQLTIIQIYIKLLVGQAVNCDLKI